MLESLLSTGELVLLTPELCVEKSVLDAVGARVKAWFETHDTLTWENSVTRSAPRATTRCWCWSITTGEGFFAARAMSAGRARSLAR